MTTSIVFLVFAALFCALGVLKGKKYTWVFSAARIVGAVIAALLTMLLSVLLAGVIAGAAVGAIGDSMTGDLAGLLGDLPTLRLAMETIIAMLISPILFWPIFPIVYNLLNILLKWICRMIVKKMPQKVSGVGEPAVKPGKKAKKHIRNAPLRATGLNPVGMILGGVCGFLLFCIALVPMVGLTGTVHDVTIAAMTAMADEDGLPDEIVSALDEADNNVGSVIVRGLGGRALYNGLTTHGAGENAVRLDREISFVGSLGKAIMLNADDKTPRAEAAEAVRGLETSLQNTALIPQVGAEFLSAASDRWAAGEDFHGISMPSAESYKSLIQTLVSTQKNATSKSFCEDAGTVIRMAAVLVEQNAIDEVKENTTALFGNRELTEDLLYELLENPRLYVAVGSALDLGVEKIGDNLQMHNTRATLYDELCDALANVERLTDADDVDRAAADYRKVMEAYGIAAEDNEVYERAALASVGEPDMAKWFAEEGVVSADTMLQKTELVTTEELEIAPVVVQNKAEEAKQLSAALAAIEDVVDKAGKSDADVADFIVDFGPVLDALSATETVGRQTSGKIFKAILQSGKVSEQIGFSMLEASDAADTINVNAHRSSYATQMRSLSQTVRVIRDAGTDGAEAAIEELIKDLTPESASTLQALSTPSVMINHGVPEKNSEPVSNMMSDMFGNLSDAKETGMSDEQLERETAAVNKVMTMGMNAGDSNGKAFGEGSVTGTSADQFVSDIMASDVVSATVVEQVYGEGNDPQNDPLASERTMTDAEEGELLTALNNQWTNATDEQKADEAYGRKLISIAALMNIEVTLGADGVTKVV